MAHTNLHGLGHSTSEVRIAVAEHYDRDLTGLRIKEGIATLALLYLVRGWPWQDMLAIAAVVLGFTEALKAYVDNSNRNWWLHHLNWEDAQRTEQQRAQEQYDIQQMLREERLEAQRRDPDF